jgi:AcrR family transcriptional regulator
MARIVKEYEVRRSEILDAAQRLIYTCGYEQMTIQDILDDLQISKGAFYHYFDSKQALLEAMIEHVQDQMQEILLPIAEDPNLSFFEKFRRFNDRAVSWKNAQKSALLNLARSLYADDNAIMRQKMIASSTRRFGPLYAAIIRQGIQEGVLHVAYPEETAEIIMSILSSMGETIIKLVLSDEPVEVVGRRMVKIAGAYNTSLERILGAPPGSIDMVDQKTVKEWIVQLGNGKDSM